MKKNKVLVLLSSYNGEKYIAELIESVLNQKEVDINMLIRDDGSKDKTTDIVREYMLQHNNIELYSGENLGYAKSFWDLIKVSSQDYDYYAFCDQDDIWEENKIISAINLISKENEYKNKPILYTSNVKCINNNKEYILGNAFEVNRVLNKYETFQKSILPGCTFVFNKCAKKILEKYDGFMESHDWAAYAIINVFGTVVYDTNSYIGYRIHESNTIGIDNKWNKVKGKFKRFFKKSKCVRSKFAKDFYECYEEILPQSIKEDVKELAYYKEKLKFKVKLLFNSNFKGFIFKFYVLMNKI